MNEPRITLTIEVPVGLERAWQAWTEPGELTRWLTLKARVEPRLGGAYELFWEPEHPERNSTIGCRISNYSRPSLLAFQWKGPA